MLVGWSQFLFERAPPAWSEGDHRLAAIATLGPEGTSSHAVARSLARTSGRVGDISLHPAFEAAAAEVIDGGADLLLVAAAYLKLNAFLMDGRLELVDTVVHNTPAYVVAGPATAHPPGGNEPPPLYTHPSPLPLLTRLVPDVAERFALREVASTSLAAARAREEGAFAFTNLEAASAHGLAPVTAPAAITMLWLLFRAATETDER